MGNIRVNDREKELLHTLVSYPNVPLEDLRMHTRYKWSSTVVKKLGELKEKCMLSGPFYDLYQDTLCKNPFHSLVCILELAQDYETAMSYLSLIEPLWSISPVLSYKKVLIVIFYSSDNAEMMNLLQLLTDSNILSSYEVRVLRTRVLVQYPNLFGDANPSLRHVLDACAVPDMSLKYHSTDWNECDVSILPYLLLGVENAKLVEILRRERRRYRFWTYEQVRYSHEKMIRNGLVEKRYGLFPFPHDECIEFDLFLRTEDPALIPEVLHNFARGERVYKEYAVSGDWGMVSYKSHPLFLVGLMSKLDQIEEITEKEVYQINSHSRNRFVRRFLNFACFDVDTQTLRYPYQVYREKIKEKLESECLIY